ncbi:unnamed protein product [Echinostoma caproni]|uniref:ANK_REP_REGION domain-containing protein n=1 Tax=Echinostoma caproni TaxID=27848 RepID=A0A183AZ46_9TREM|nr:unnamed protein product [Echinostoma caproni]
MCLLHRTFQAGTPVDIRDREGRTPLQLAAWQGHAAICQLLLEEGNARVDAVCSQGATSLCIAAQEGHAHVCSVLLQAGANPFQADSHGRTPYRVALKAGHVEICELLEQRYGSNHPSWFDPNGRESLSPEMNPHRTPIDQAHGPSGGHGLVGRGHSRLTAQDYPRGVAVSLTAANPIPVLSGPPPPPPPPPAPPLLEGNHHPVHHHHNHVSTRRDYGDDTNPYARPPGPLAAQRFQQPSSDNSCHSEVHKILPSMRFQPPGPHVNSSGNPASFLHPEAFVHADVMHPTTGQHGPWQYSSSAGFPPTFIQTSDLHSGGFIPLGHYPGKSEPPGYDSVHANAYHRPIDHGTPHGPTGHLPPHVTAHHSEVGESLPVRAPGSLHPGSRILQNQAVNADGRTPVESHRVKQSQHHHHQQQSKEPNHRAVAQHRSTRPDGRESGNDLPDRLGATASKHQNLREEPTRHASSRVHQDVTAYPDLLPHQFHQVPVENTRGEPLTPVTGSVFPTNASGGTRAIKSTCVVSSAGPITKDRSQTPRHRDEPPPLPQHATNPSSSGLVSSGTSGTASVSLVAQAEQKRHNDERSVSREVSFHTSSNPTPPQESKTSSAKSTLAGMLRFGNRRGKKSRKQPFGSPDLTSSPTPTSCVSGATGVGPLRTKLKPSAQSKTVDDPGSDRLPCVSQPGRSGLESHGMKPNPLTLTPTQSGHEAPDRGVTSSMQLEALARKLACCTQIEGVPSSNPTFLSRSQLAASKPYSPQLWDRQSVRNDSNRPPL